MAKHHDKRNYISIKVEIGHAFFTATPQGKMHVGRGYVMLKGCKESLKTD